MSSCWFFLHTASSQQKRMAEAPVDVLQAAPVDESITCKRMLRVEETRGLVGSSVLVHAGGPGVGTAPVCSAPVSRTTCALDTRLPQVTEWATSFTSSLG